MDINNLVLTDDAVATIDNGAWVGDLAGAPGVKLKVRGWGSKSVQDFIDSKKSN